MWEAEREAIADALAREPGMSVVGASAGGSEGLMAVRRSRPGVVVLTEPSGDAYEAWVADYRRASGSAKVVLLEIGRRAVELTNNGGADAAVDAGDGMAELAAAIRSVAGG